MTYTAQSGREQILGDVVTAASELAEALAALGDAYERLDEHMADRVEEQLFRPLQAAYGQIKRTHAEFAARYDLPGSEFANANPHLPEDPRLTIERAAESIRTADEMLAELQDSMLPVEVGDQELRAGLSRVRSLIDLLPSRGEELIRTLGR